MLDAASTTSATITGHATALDTLLLNTIGFAQAGTNLLAPNKQNSSTRSTSSSRPPTC